MCYIWTLCNKLCRTFCDFCFFAKPLCLKLYFRQVFLLLWMRFYLKCKLGCFSIFQVCGGQKDCWHCLVECTLFYWCSLESTPSSFCDTSRTNWLCRYFLCNVFLILLFAFHILFRTLYSKHSTLKGQQEFIVRKYSTVYYAILDIAS